MLLLTTDNTVRSFLEGPAGRIADIGYDSPIYRPRRRCPATTSGQPPITVFEVRAVRIDMSEFEDNVERDDGGGFGPDGGGGGDDDAPDEDGYTWYGVVIALVLGLGLMYGSYAYYDDIRKANNTVPVEATTVESDYSETTGPDGPGDRVFRIDITYEYQYKGETYTSSNYARGPDGYRVDTEFRAEQIMDSFEPGDTVEAHVNPNDPTVAHIRDRRDLGITERVGSLVGFLLGLLLFGSGAKATAKWVLKTP